MKKLLFFCCICTALTSQAQFSRTYNLPTKGMTGSSMALIHQTTTKDIVFVSWGVDTVFNPITGSQITTCALAKTDSLGNVLQAIQRDSSHAIERVFETHDNGILLVSHFNHTVVFSKFDDNLALQWANDLPMQPALYSPGQQGYIDIEAVFDSTAPPGLQESYYVTFPGGPIDPMYAHDLHINVAKINEDGSLGWHKSYAESTRQSTNTLYAYQDYARGITSFDTTSAPNDRVFAITGNRTTFDPWQSNFEFVFLVDENGTPLSDFQQITTADYQPDYGDILWDGDSLVITYIEENGGFNTVDPGNASGLGIIKFDAGFTTFRGKYHWDECETYGLSLSLSDDDHYVIGGFASRCYVHTSVFSSTIALTKLNRNTLNEEFYQRYDVYNDNMNYGFHRTHPQTGEHLLIGEVHTPFINGTFADVRMVKTSPSGFSCESEEFDLQTLDFTPSITTYPYMEVESQEMFPNGLMWNNVLITEKGCDLTGGSDDGDGSTDADRLKFADQENKVFSSAWSVELSTNLMDYQAGETRCQVSAPENGTVELTVVNMTGQIVYVNEETVAAGEHTFAVAATSLSAGMNFFRFVVNGQVIHTEKVVVLK